MTVRSFRLLASLGTLVICFTMGACEEGSGDLPSPIEADLSAQELQGSTRLANSGWHAANSGIETATVRALAVDAYWPALAYAVTLDGVYRTSTTGASWQRVTAIPAETSVNVVADPNQFGVAYAGGAYADGQLYKTSDGGQTWTPNAALATRERGPGQAPYARPLAVAGADSKVIYAAVDGVRQLFLARSIDGGETWSVAPAPGDRGACCLAVLAQNADHAYLSTLAQAPSLYETVDGGQTWTRLSLNLAFIESLASDPRDPKVLYAMGLATNGSAPSQRVLRKSTDGGATWFAPSEQLAPYNVDSLSVSKVDGRVYVSISESAEVRTSKVLVSRDGAATFENANLGLEAQGVQTIVPMPGRRCGAYAGTRGAGVFKTNDSGGVCR